MTTSMVLGPSSASLVADLPPTCTFSGESFDAMSSSLSKAASHAKTARPFSRQENRFTTHRICSPSGNKIHTTKSARLVGKRFTQNLPASWEKDSHAQAVHCLAVKTEAWHKKQTVRRYLTLKLHTLKLPTKQSKQNHKISNSPKSFHRFFFFFFSSKGSVRPVVHFQRRTTAWLFDGWGGKNLTMH